MKKIQLFILNCLIIALSSCDSFLDIVPDDIATCLLYTSPSPRDCS